MLKDCRAISLFSMPFIFFAKVALIFKLHNDLARKITLTGLKFANRVMFRDCFSLTPQEINTKNNLEKLWQGSQGKISCVSPYLSNTLSTRLTASTFLLSTILAYICIVFTLEC